MSQTMSYELDRLFERARDNRKPLDEKALFRIIVRFRHMAPFNAALVYIQKPGTQFAASAEDWERRFHRTVKPNAQPIVILRPFGPVDFVYDLGDTEGEPLPDAFYSADPPPQGITEADLDRLRRHMALAGIGYEERAYGSSQSAAVRFQEDCRILHVPAAAPQGKDKQIESHVTVIVKTGLNPTAKFTAILHELAHYYCGHLIPPDFPGNVPHRDGLPEIQQEFEAEGCAWLIAHRLGIDCCSEAYLADYLDGDRQIPPVSKDAMLRAVGQIERIIRGTLR